MGEITVGTVLWEMRGRRQNDKIKWHAEPICVEEIREHMYIFGNGSGCSHNGVGKSLFLSREECINNFLKSHNSMDEKIDIEQEIDSSIRDKVVELPRTDFEDLRIYPSFQNGQILRIFVDDKIISENEFDWEKEDDKFSEYTGCSRSMKLNMLSSQWYTKHKRGIITVVTESALHGEIYQIGNYPEMKWVKHGTTRGYA